MATLPIADLPPDSDLASKVLPEALRQSLKHLFAESDGKCWLVGGTALAGYYAAHRRSDDLDLFVKDALSYTILVRSAQQLQTAGAQIIRQSHTPYYYRAELSWLDHPFTLDIVLDENLHRIGSAHLANNGVWIASLPTLLATKIACLLSRCSEKDLYDLCWLFSQMSSMPTIADLISSGQNVDAGLTCETLLISLQGAPLRQSACDFLLPKSLETPATVYAHIQSLRQQLIQALLEFEKQEPPPLVAQTLSNHLHALRRSKKTWR